MAALGLDFSPMCPARGFAQAERVLVTAQEYFDECTCFAQGAKSGRSPGDERDDSRRNEQ